MKFNLATDVGSGLTGPVKVSYDAAIPYIFMVILVIVVLAIIIGVSVHLRKSSKNKDFNRENNPSRIDLASAEVLKREKRQDSEEFANLTDDEKELIRKHREKNNKVDD